MRLDFQFNVLRWIAQSQDARYYLQYLDKSIFDIEHDQFIFVLLKQYWNRYNQKPDRASLFQYFDKFCEQKQVGSDTVEELESRIEKVYKRLGNADFVKDEIVDQSRKKMIKDTFKTYLKKNQSEEDYYDNLFKDISKIVNLGKQIDRPKGKYLIKDYKPEVFTVPKGNPCFLQGVNGMTAAGGFYSPQLIIFLKAPKVFGTGFLLALAIEYMAQGFNIYYADFDNNGISSLEARCMQYLLTCEYMDIGNHLAEYKETLDHMAQYGAGDFRIQSFRANKDSIQDVANDLDLLEMEDGFKPHIIMYDYLDKVASDDKSIKENRLKIQNVYQGAASLNEKIGTFCFSVSKINKAAFGKDYIQAGDIGEDTEKLYNAHASFSINRSETDEKYGCFRINPLLQRQGVSNKKESHECFVEVNEATHYLKERFKDEIDEENLTDD